MAIPAVQSFKFLFAVEQSSLSLRFLLRDYGNPELDKARIVIVAVDDRSLYPEVSQADVEDNPGLIHLMGDWPWSRAVHGLLAQRLLNAGAKVVAFDFVFPNPNSGDLEFLDVIEANPGSIVLGFDYSPSESELGETLVEERLPYDDLLPVNDEGVLGFVNIHPGSPIQPINGVADEALNSVELRGDDIKVGSTRLIAAEGVRLDGTTRIIVDSSSISANFIEFSADEIQTSNNTYTGNDMTLKGGRLLEISAADLATLANVNLAARTLVLNDVKFSSSSSSIMLGSANGLLADNPNTAAVAQTGFVNFISNVTLDGNPAQDYVSVAQGGTGASANLISLYSVNP